MTGRYVVSDECLLIVIWPIMNIRNSWTLEHAGHHETYKHFLPKVSWRARQLHFDRAQRDDRRPRQLRTRQQFAELDQYHVRGWAVICPGW